MQYYKKVKKVEKVVFLGLPWGTRQVRKMTVLALWACIANNKDGIRRPIFGLFFGGPQRGHRGKRGRWERRKR